MAHARKERSARPARPKGQPKGPPPRWLVELATQIVAAEIDAAERITEIAARHVWNAA